MTFQEIVSTPNYTFSTLLHAPVNLGHFSVVISELIDLHTHYYGIHPNRFKLINDYSNSNYPMTCRDRKTIYVNCRYFYVPQFIYQFTHELCHWMIPENVTTNLRWFEETLAVASSWFFPVKMTCVDMSTLQPYIEDTKTSGTSLDISELFKVDSTTIVDLENNPNNFTDYEKYKYIALKLLPKIEENPAFWRAVPKICDIPCGLPFEESLNHWKTMLSSGPVLDAFSKVICSLQ